MANSPTYSYGRAARKTNNTLECPCFVHTFETGDYFLSKYLHHAAPSSRVSTELPGCNYLNLKTTGFTDYWSIKAPTAKTGARTIVSSTFYDDVAKIKETGATAANKSDSIILAPAILFKPDAAGAAQTYNIKVTVATENAAASILGIGFRERESNEPIPKGGGTRVLSVHPGAFGAAVKNKMSELQYDLGDYRSSDGSEFTTNGKVVTIDFELTGPTETKLLYLEITDYTKMPTSDHVRSTVQILDVKVEAPSLPTIPIKFPDIEFDVKDTDAGSRMLGSLFIKASADLNPGDCLWCFEQRLTSGIGQSAISDVRSGIYTVRGINVKEGYTLPLAKVTVGLKNGTTYIAGAAVASELPALDPTVYGAWSDCSFAHLGDKLVADMRISSKVCTQALTELTLMSYLFSQIWDLWAEANIVGLDNPLTGEPIAYGDTMIGPPALYTDSYSAFSQDALWNVGYALEDGAMNFVSNASYLGWEYYGTYSISYNNGLNISGYPGPDFEIGDSLGGIWSGMGVPSIDGIFPIYEPNSIVSNVTSGSGWFGRGWDQGSCSGLSWSLFAKMNARIAEINSSCAPCSDDALKGEDITAFKMLKNRGSRSWNSGIGGRAYKGKCCIGDVEYLYPAVVYHKGAIWGAKSAGSETRYEPGSYLGREHWLKVTNKNTSPAKATKKYLDSLEKKYIFTLESTPSSLTNGSGDTGRLVKTLVIETENLKPLKRERQG